MESIKFIPVPSEDYDTLGIGPDTVLQTSMNENGDLVIHVVTGEELEEFVCDGNCDSCPVAETDCDSECLSCPCYANCADSDCIPEGVCKSHGARRDSV